MQADIRAAMGLPNKYRVHRNRRVSEVPLGKAAFKQCAPRVRRRTANRSLGAGPGGGSESCRRAAAAASGLESIIATLIED